MSLIAPFQLSMLASLIPKWKTLETHFRCAPSRDKQSRHYHTPISHQRRFVGGIAMVLFMMGCAIIQEHFIPLDGLGIAGAVVLLLLLWELRLLRHKWRRLLERCPFTSNAGTQDFSSFFCAREPVCKVDGQPVKDHLEYLAVVWCRNTFISLCSSHISTLLIQPSILRCSGTLVRPG